MKDDIKLSAEMKIAFEAAMDFQDTLFVEYADRSRDMAVKITPPPYAGETVLLSVMLPRTIERTASLLLSMVHAAAPEATETAKDELIRLIENAYARSKENAEAFAEWGKQAEVTKAGYAKVR